MISLPSSCLPFQGKRIVLFIIFPEMNFRANSQSRPSVGLRSEPWTSVRGSM